MTEQISESINRVDGADKINGTAKYISDIQFKAQYFARTVRSQIPKGRIESIQIPSLPEGYYIIDKNDIPGENRMRTVECDNPIFADEEVNYIGQPILLVTGPSREIIAEIIDEIKVVYEEKEPVFTIEEAEQKKAVLSDYQYSKGQPDSVFENATGIITDQYKTGFQEHIYIEPQGITAVYRDNKIFVFGSMQCPFYIKGALQDVLDWTEDRIRVIHTTTGGAFGGKEEFPSMIACQAAVAAYQTGYPVKIIYDRDEDIIASTKRHPSIVTYRAALDENNKIAALEIDVKFNAGAYSGISPVVLERGIFSATGVYNFPNLIVKGKNYRTNSVPCGAFRGFGAPQTIFSMEMFMHNLAERLGEKPLEFKQKHLIQHGHTTATGGKMHSEVKLPEIINKIDKMSNYQDKYGNLPRNRGIGISLFLHGCGFTGDGENKIKGKIVLLKRGEEVIIKVSSTDMGQGAETCLRKIVSHTLGLPMKQIIYRKVDTGRVPDSGPTVASRTVMIVGGLLRSAALEMKENWNDHQEMEISRIYSHPDYLKWNNATFEGDAYPVYSFGANVVEVEVDPVTLELNIDKLYAVYDVGTIIDEKGLRGQMEGGIMQGLGWATTEVMETDGGQLLQKNMTDYKIPTIQDVPEIQCAFVPNPYEFGPFGAKCAGELPMNGPAPALTAAVSHALSRPIKEIPLRPESLLEVNENEN